MALDLQRAQKSAHHTKIQIPIGTEDGESGAWEEIEIWFRPLTPSMLDSLSGEVKNLGLSSIEGIALWLSQCLIRWDVTDQGLNVAPTLEVLRSLNRLQLEAIMEGIQAYIYPKNQTSQTSKPTT